MDTIDKEKLDELNEAKREYEIEKKLQQFKELMPSDKDLWKEAAVCLLIAILLAVITDIEFSTLFIIACAIGYVRSEVVSESIKTNKRLNLVVEMLELKIRGKK